MNKKDADGVIILSKGEKIFNVVNIIILGLLSVACLYPLAYVFACSISYGPTVDAGLVLLFPKGINLDSYKAVLEDRQFWVSYGNTFYYTIFGSIFSMCVSAPAAFTLSRRRFKARRLINLLVSFTMWFSPGFIPLYLNYSSLGTINNRPMIVVSFGIQAFNIILLRNYFESVPQEMEESAMIDGASTFRTFLQIFIPLSGPSLATVWLYYAMSRWNGYFWSSVLLREMDKIPLQVYLKQKIIDQALVTEFAQKVQQQLAVGQRYSYTTLIYALVFCSIVPVLIIYPLIQRFFVKGVMVGGVKG